MHSADAVYIVRSSCRRYGLLGLQLQLRKLPGRKSPDWASAACKQPTPPRKSSRAAGWSWRSWCSGVWVAVGSAAAARGRAAAGGGVGGPAAVRALAARPWPTPRRKKNMKIYVDRDNAASAASARAVMLSILSVSETYNSTRTETYVEQLESTTFRWADAT
jgi:hypothetical protein